MSLKTVMTASKIFYVAGVLKLYCPIVIVPGNKKYPTRLSGWVVQIISRAPSHHVARHVPRPPPTD